MAEILRRITTSKVLTSISHHLRHDSNTVIAASLSLFLQNNSTVSIPCNGAGNHSLSTQTFSFHQHGIPTRSIHQFPVGKHNLLTNTNKAGKKNEAPTALIMVDSHHAVLLQGSRREFRDMSSEIINSGSIEMSDLVEHILEATRRVDVMTDSLPIVRTEQLVRGLTNMGFDSDSIKHLLSGKLWLLRQSETTLALCQLLLDHGIVPYLVCNVICDIPYSHQNELHLLSTNINEALLFLRSFGFSEKEIYSVISNTPSVLFIDKHSIRTAIARIQALFPAADTKKVICMSPNVLYEDWPSILVKFDYCVFTMGYNQFDIVRSRLFFHSSRHIQDRHLFLQRAGVFKTVNKKLDPSLNPNPALKRVVDSSDASFVKLVEGVCVYDYHVFRRMREIERETEEEIEHDGNLKEEDVEGDDVDDNNVHNFRNVGNKNSTKFSLYSSDNTGANSQKVFKRNKKFMKKKDVKKF